MKTCINWYRIIANGGLAFCTTLVATGINAEAAVINAALIAGVALFTEMKTETEPKTRVAVAVNKAQKVLSQALIL